MRALLALPSDTDVQGMERLLKECFLSVTTVFEAEKAVETIEEGYELVFWDTALPSIEVEAVQKIVQDVLPETILFSVSTRGLPETRIEDLESGGFWFFPDPLAQPRLFKRCVLTVVELISLHRVLGNALRSYQALRETSPTYPQEQHVVDDLWFRLLSRMRPDGD